MSQVNQFPVAIIEVLPNTTVVENSTIILNGSRSYDPDGYITSYVWNFENGTFIGNNAVETLSLVRGTYTIYLTVVDDRGFMSQENVTIIVNPPTPGNQPPVAVIEVQPSVTVTEGTIQTLNASKSYDPDGNITNYLWNFENGTVIGTGETASVNLGVGSYVVYLTVWDNEGLQAIANVTLTINSASGGGSGGGGSGGGSSGGSSGGGSSGGGFVSTSLPNITINKINGSTILKVGRTHTFYALVKNNDNKAWNNLKVVFEYFNNTKAYYFDINASENKTYNVTFTPSEEGTGVLKVKIYWFSHLIDEKYVYLSVVKTVPKIKYIHIPEMVEVGQSFLVEGCFEDAITDKIDIYIDGVYYKDADLDDKECFKFEVGKPLEKGNHSISIVMEDYEFDYYVLVQGDLFIRNVKIPKLYVGKKARVKVNLELTTPDFVVTTMYVNGSRVVSKKVYMSGEDDIYLDFVPEYTGIVKIKIRAKMNDIVSEREYIRRVYKSSWWSNLKYKISSFIKGGGNKITGFFSRVFSFL